MDAVVDFLEDGATGAGVFNGFGAGAGAGAGVDAIVGVFVNNTVCGADRVAVASRAMANAAAACAEISSLPLCPPTLHSISASTPSLA